MPEVTKQIKVIGVDYICDKCGKGLMMSTGVCLDSMPAYYPHVCNNCGYEVRFEINYPTTRYEEIRDETP